MENHKFVEATHLNLNDNTIEGIRITNKNAFSVQYHPEANPGPQDSIYLFEEFRIYESISRDSANTLPLCRAA